MSVKSLISLSLFMSYMFLKVHAIKPQKKFGLTLKPSNTVSLSSHIMDCSINGDHVVTNAHKLLSCKTFFDQ